MILDQLIGVSSNAVYPTFFPSHLGKLNFHEVCLMNLRENHRGVPLGRYFRRHPSAQVLATRWR
jgi:hypothetical protein